VVGVDLRAAGSDGPGEPVDAALVIDASGRGSRILRWLEAAGYPAPPQDEQTLDLCYASLVCAPVPQVPDGVDAILVYGKRPEHRRHGIAFRYEHGDWLISLMGYGGDHPPLDTKGFCDFAGSLAHPQIARLLEGAELRTQVRRFKIPRQVRRHFHRTTLPRGLGVMGDAACSLDPVFGQGMSVACLQARALGEMLAAGPFDTAAFARACNHVADRAWLITTLEGYRYPAAGRRPPGLALMHRFLDRVFDAASHDPQIYRAFLRVMQLERGALHMARPDLLPRLLRPVPRSTREQQLHLGVAPE
jgi:flavin-dependent dehydrogenase